MVSSSNEITFPARADRLFEDLARSVPGLVWLSDLAGNVDFVNCTWCEYTGISREASLGRDWLEAVHPDDLTTIEAVTKSRPDRDSPPHEIEVRIRRKDGRYRWHLVRANPLADSPDRWIGCSIDIHDMVAIQKKGRELADILGKIVSGEAVDAILEELCALGEDQLAGSRCTVLLLDDEGREFIGGAAPFLPADIQALIPGTRAGTGVGSCGTAAFEKRDVISSSIATDPLWDSWRDVFAPLGVKACWSRPIYGTDGRVLATFGFYFFEERRPSRDELQNLDNLGQLAALAIEKARTNQALRESEDHHRHTVEHNPQIPWTADTDGKILSVSSRWHEATGLSVASALGNGWFQALHPDDVADVKTYWAAKLETGDPADLKYRIRLHDGSYRWVRARATPRRDEDGRIMRWYGAVEDIHDLELANERLRKLAFTDELTRLANRRTFENALCEALSHAGTRHPVELLIIDLLGFRHLNDRYGHEAGDATLRMFAALLRSCFTKDDVIGRIAGDQFAVVVHDHVGEAGLQRYAAGLAKALEQRLAGNTKTRNIGVNIGCALSAPGDRCDDLLRRAKAALYAAKGGGTGTVKLFTPALQHSIDVRIEQIELAREALKDSWLVPYYQPMIDLVSGRVAGAEALLRLKNPAGGVRSPTSIWAALDAPKIGKAINDQMLSLVLADLGEWGPWPAELGTISINLSTEILTQEGLARSLLRRLEKNALEPHHVTIEITERVMVDDLAPRARHSLEQLRQQGVRVSLDDFGTGFASLTHLQRLPVDEIKIDRSFVADLGRDRSGTAIVKSMIHLGQNMGVDVVAEGVETAAQAALLKEWGCRFAQGYYFYRPLPAKYFGRIWCAITKADSDLRKRSAEPGLTP